jgi:hypothetical protein
MSALIIASSLLVSAGPTWQTRPNWELAKDAQAIAPGQHDIEDDGVVTACGREDKAVVAITRVVDDEALLDEAMAIAERIVCNPPRALRLTKRLLREAQHSRMSDILELSAAYQAIIHETADNREAINAFVEKRPPVFTGD